MGLLQDGRWHGRVFTGRWVETKATAESTEPATGKALGTFGLAGGEELSRSAAEAAEAGAAWDGGDYREREAVLRRAATVLESEREEVTEWLMRESGKAARAAQMEVDLAIGEIWEAVPLASQPFGQLLRTGQPDRVSIARRVPLGVVAVIAPWNFPLNLAMRSVAPALACGNGVVLKPASETVVCCGVTIARLFEDAGLPPGVLHMLPGRGSELGTAFADERNIDMISFTGSTPVGKQLSEAAGRNLKRMVAELGGNNPLIVLEDADVEKAAKAGAYGSFTHQGQICMAVGRHLVAEALAEDYAQAVAEIADSLSVGDPIEGADLGPIINQSQLEHIEDLVRRSVEAGAKLRAGGTSDGLFLRPTVLSDVGTTMAAYEEEIFGPVAAITSFRDDAHALELANSTPFGLVAGVHSGSAARARAVGDRLHAGMVHVNDQTVNDEVLAPFGGRKDSGTGAFGSLVNGAEFTTWQWMTLRETQSAPS